MQVNMQVYSKKTDTASKVFKQVTDFINFMQNLTVDNIASFKDALQLYFTLFPHGWIIAGGYFYELAGDNKTILKNNWGK